MIMLSISVNNTDKIRTYVQIRQFHKLKTDYQDQALRDILF